MSQLFLEHRTLHCVQAVEIGRHAVDVVCQTLELTRTGWLESAGEIALSDACEVESKLRDWLRYRADAALPDPQADASTDSDGEHHQEQIGMVYCVGGVDAVDGIVVELVAQCIQRGAGELHRA